MGNPQLIQPPPPPEGGIPAEYLAYFNQAVSYHVGLGYSLLNRGENWALLLRPRASSGPPIGNWMAHQAYVNPRDQLYMWLDGLGQVKLQGAVPEPPRPPRPQRSSPWEEAPTTSGPVTRYPAANIITIIAVVLLIAMVFLLGLGFATGFLPDLFDTWISGDLL